MLPFSEPRAAASKAGRADHRGISLMDQMSEKDLQSILEGLRGRHENPVARARKIVELEVPYSRRGPGWDRHWRELEAYLETPGYWSSEVATE